ncbi:hypothetical protein QWY77_02335 [Thalassotalea ponticola]|uniref:hypothetical protein n=1 Tax=Thalassotalea ponticola TaxID=1523392 RepID=UPI0025B3D6E0|nr:hypothetical protein [Thalassotalea ponticola]MDN3651608.1 hypothetical protein [Thalassotalea ponticola]
MLALFFTNVASLAGFTVVPTEKFDQLTASHDAIEKLKLNHAKQKTLTTEHFFNRTSQKVGQTALSALTIGAQAVVGTLTYMELNEYCEEKQRLSEQENLLFNINNGFDFDTCLRFAKKDSIDIKEQAWNMVKKTANVDVVAAGEDIKTSQKELAKQLKQIESLYKQP